MNKLKNRVICVVLAVTVALGLAAPALAASVTDFADVPDSAWYYDYVRIACDNSLISGTSATTFSPAEAMTRGQFVTVLGRFAKAEIADSENTGKFTDVPAEQYYAPYVYWAASKGIVNGLTDTTFGPAESLTREQMVTLLVRYADSYDITIPADSSISLTFADASDISDYAQESIETLKVAGILNGDENGNVNPKNAISRAEATAMLVRFAVTIGAISDIDGPEEPIDPDYVPCVSISVGSDISLEPGATHQIPVAFNPANATDQFLSFESINTSVATVGANGLVTAVGPGETRINVYASDSVSAFVLLTVRDPNASPKNFEFEYDEWTIYTASNSGGQGYFFFTRSMTGEPVITQEKPIASGKSFTMLSPYIVYSDGYKTTRSPDNISTYGISYTSSNPALLSANADGTVTVNRVIGAAEGPQTVTVTAYSSVLKVSRAATITIRHQALYEYNAEYTEAFSREAVRLVNLERAERELSSLTYDASMLDGALVRAKELASNFSEITSSASTTLFPHKTGISEERIRNLNTHASFYSPEHIAQAAVNTFLSNSDSNLFDSTASSAAMGILFISGEQGYYGSFITATD